MNEPSAGFRVTTDLRSSSAGRDNARDRRWDRVLVIGRGWGKRHRCRAGGSGGADREHCLVRRAHVPGRSERRDVDCNLGHADRQLHQRVWIALRTLIPPISTGIDSPTGTVLVLLSAAAGGRILALGGSPEIAIQHVMLIFTAATVLLGVVLYAIGACRWGSYFRFVPYPVAGCSRSPLRI